MSLFQYTATDQEGKEVKGSLDAPSDSAARSAIESMHLELIELHEARRNTSSQEPAIAPPQQMKTFAFEGVESSGSIRRGTIQAEDKFDAFTKLQQSQNIHLNMLSPVGVTPQFKDNDLENWQRSTSTNQGKLQQSAPEEKKKLRFTEHQAIPSSTTTVPVQSPTPVQSRSYLPIIDTLRLYAGWLLAWYGIFVAIGYYVTERQLTFDVPFVQAFYLSPLIFSFVVATFGFLLFTSLHRVIRGSFLSAIVFLLIGLTLFFGVRMSVS